MPELFKLVLQEVIKVVNFIKYRALQSRLSTQLCSEMGINHIQLILHTKVRWLSFPGETHLKLNDNLTDELWIHRHWHT